MNLTKKELEIKINQIAKNLGEISLGDMLAGGVVSDIYEATIKKNNNKLSNIVVKYTKENIQQNNNFSKTDIENSFSKAPKTHNFDVEIQKALKMTTPKVIKHFPNEKITLMKDFNEDGFTLLQKLVLDNQLPKEAAIEMGIALAKIRNKFKAIGHKSLQVEESRTQFDERFYELKALLYNGRMNIFNTIESNFLNSAQSQLVWTDGDQKNFAINQHGRVMIFDLGRSIECDPDFMLPNLLGHLGLFYIGGYMNHGIDLFKRIIEGFSDAYQKHESNYNLDEEKFTEYFTASLLHRGMAIRWIDPRIADKNGEGSMKNACIHIGDLVFHKSDKITTIDKLFKLLDVIRGVSNRGGYKRPNLKL